MIGLQEGSYSFFALDCLFCSKLSKCHSVILLIVFHPSLSLSSFSSTGWWYECYHSANIFLFCCCSFLRYSVFFGHLPANTGNMRFFAALVYSCLFVMLFPHATSLFPFPVSSFSSAISSNRVWPASSFFASFSDGRAQRASAFRHLRSLPMGVADCCPETFMWPFVSAVQGRGVGASDCPSERQRNANCLDNSLLSCYVSVSVSVGWAVLSGGFPLVSPLSSCSFSAG